MENTSVFVQRLSDLLSERKMSRKSFLEEMHFGKNQFRYWESTGSIPNKSSLSSIAKFFDVSVDFLMGQTDERKSSSDVVIKDRLTDDDVVIYRRDGKTTVRKLTPEQLRLFERLLDAVDGSNSEL